MKLTIIKNSIPLATPFSITGYRFTHSNTIQVILEKDGCRGRGESIGIFFQHETADSMIEQLEVIRDKIETGINQKEVQDILPPGGARNALDCALWDLQAKRLNTSVWDRLGLQTKQLTTVATLGIDTPDQMARAATSLAKYPHLKIKLSEDDPIARLEAIRAARPDAQLIVDVNQGWTFEELKEYTPVAKTLGVAMIEQPLPRGHDQMLEGYKSPVPLGADESCLDLNDYATAASRYDLINIKLDKCGGLTEGLELVNKARRDGKMLMVGNMMGSSLSMAPAYVIGQFCQFVDIDGPLFLQKDVEHSLEYFESGLVSVPTAELWG